MKDQNERLRDSLAEAHKMIKRLEGIQRSIGPGYPDRSELLAEAPDATARKPKGMTLTGNLVEDCKRALGANMSACAAHSARVNALKAIADSEQIAPEAFYKLVGQMPDTIDRDLQSARDEYQRAKVAYETFCERTGEQAYAVYNDD